MKVVMNLTPPILGASLLLVSFSLTLAVRIMRPTKELEEIRKTVLFAGHIFLAMMFQIARQGLIFGGGALVLCIFAAIDLPENIANSMAHVPTVVIFITTGAVLATMSETAKRIQVVY